MPNLALTSTTSTDVKLFLEGCTNATIEQALTEFSARVCYNSVKKMGTAPNFIKKVLSSGHLSVAEHASLMLPKSTLRNLSVVEIFKRNRYFDFPKGHVAGNMRCWLELMERSTYLPFHEFVVAALGDVFETSPYVTMAELHEWSDEAGVFVPSYENFNGPNVYLLAVNPGTFVKSGAPGKERTDKWARYTWLVEGVSRSLTHQLVRHRGASFSQESQRYVDFRNNGDKNYLPFVYPDGMSTDDKDNLYWMNEQATINYEVLRTSGLRKEDARFVLPNGAATRLVVSFNLRELTHFLNVRCATDAQWEIRRLAKIMLQQASLAYPCTELEILKEAHKVGPWGE